MAALVAGCFCRIISFLPLSPLPALAERSSPVGKGENFSFLMQGATAPCIPGVEPMVCHKTERKRFPASDAARVQSPGTCSARSVSAAGGLTPGMQGAKPLAQNNPWAPPSPEGKGAGGLGAEKQANGRFTHRPAGQAARRVPETAGAVRAAGGLMPGMQGAKPLAQNNLGLPLPLRGRGVGGIGAINL